MSVPACSLKTNSKVLVGLDICKDRRSSGGIPPEAWVMDTLEESTLGEAHCSLRADDDVVEHSNVDEPQGVLEPAGEALVGPTGVYYSGGVVMGEDDGGGVVPEGRFYHLAGVDGSSVDGAGEHNLELDHPVAGVEEECSEHLVFQWGEPKAKEFPRVRRAGKRLSALTGFEYRRCLSDQLRLGSGPSRGVFTAGIPDENAFVEFFPLHDVSLLVVVFTRRKAKRACGHCRVPWTESDLQ